MSTDEHNGKEQYISLYDNLQMSTVPFVCVYVNIIFNLDSSLLLLELRQSVNQPESVDFNKLRIFERYTGEAIYASTQAKKERRCLIWKNNTPLDLWPELIQL